MTAHGTIYNIQRMSTKDGPGLRTTVFFKGCPLSCIWCSNPESQSSLPQHMHFKKLCSNCLACAAVCPTGAVTLEKDVPEHMRIDRHMDICVNCGACVNICPTGAATISGKNYSVDEVMRIIAKDAAFYMASDGGVTFGGGECTMQPEFLLDLMDSCLDIGLHLCVDTCGQTSPDIFAHVADRADLFLYDIKHMDSSEHKKLTGHGNELILRNLATLLAEMPEKVRIRIPLMPEMNDSMENICNLADFLLPFGISDVEVMPCHHFGRSKYEALRLSLPNVNEYGPKELHKALERFRHCGLRPEIA